jgi:hypothetical protein
LNISYQFTAGRANAVEQDLVFAQEIGSPNRAEFGLRIGYRPALPGGDIDENKVLAGEAQKRVTAGPKYGLK